MPRSGAAAVQDLDLLACAAAVQELGVLACVLGKRLGFGVGTVTVHIRPLEPRWNHVSFEVQETWFVCKQEADLYRCVFFIASTRTVAQRGCLFRVDPNFSRSGARGLNECEG